MSGFPRALLLDLDNTLYDYHATAARALDEVARTAGVEPALFLERYRALPAVEEAGKTGFALRRLRLELLLRQFPGATLAPEEAALLFGRVFLASVAWFPGEAPALARLAQRMRILIVTEGREEISRPIVQTLGLDATAWPVLFTFDQGVTKRDGSAFAQALRWLALAPEEAVALGDNWTLDILGGARAGLRQIWKGAPPLPGEPPPGFLGMVSNLDEAHDLLNQRS